MGFQIMTFDSWCSGIARPIILTSGVDWSISTVFFVSYVLISGFIMANVVLAILLDKFLEASKDAQTELEENKKRLADEERLAELEAQAGRVVRSASKCDLRSRRGSDNERRSEVLGRSSEGLEDAPLDDFSIEGFLTSFVEECPEMPFGLLAAEWRLTARMAEVEAR